MSTNITIPSHVIRHLSTWAVRRRGVVTLGGRGRRGWDVMGDDNGYIVVDAIGLKNIEKTLDNGTLVYILTL